MDGAKLELVTGYRPDGSFGPCGYGDWDQVLRSFAERAADKRWDSDVLAARQDNCTEGIVALHRSRVAELPDANLRWYLGGLDPSPALPQDARELLFIGGHSGLIGGMAVRHRSEPQLAERTLATLAAHAVRIAAGHEAVPVALFVPHDQVPAMVHGWGPGVTVYPGGLQSTMRLDGATTLEEFLAGCAQHTRYTWRRDIREFTGLGIRAERETLSPQLIQQAAPLVADVKVRNGTFDAAALTGYRLRRWVADCGDRCVAFVLRGADGELLGVSMGEVRPPRLAMTDIGIVGEHPHRSAIYRELAFHAPMRLALDERLDEVWLGSDHEVPKRVRGATQVPQWHLVGIA